MATLGLHPRSRRRHPAERRRTLPTPFACHPYPSIPRRDLCATVAVKSVFRLFVRSFVRSFARSRSVRSNNAATKSIPHARTVSKHPRQRRVMHANQLEPFRLAFALCRFAIPVPNPSQHASILCASSIQMRDEIDHRVRSVIIRRKHRDARATSVGSSVVFVSLRASRPCVRAVVGVSRCIVSSASASFFVWSTHEVKRRARFFEYFVL